MSETHNRFKIGDKVILIKPYLSSYYKWEREANYCYHNNLPCTVESLRLDGIGVKMHPDAGIRDFHWLFDEEHFKLYDLNSDDSFIKNLYKEE